MVLELGWDWNVVLKVSINTRVEIKMVIVAIAGVVKIGSR